MEPKTIYIAEGVIVNLAHVVSVDFGITYTTDDYKERKYVAVRTVSGDTLKCCEPYISALKMALCDMLGPW